MTPHPPPAPEPDDARPDEARDRRIPALVLALTALVFLPGLAGDFVWDDRVLVLENQLTGDLGNLPRFFRVDLWESTPVAEPESGFYRPLVLLDFAVDRTLFGLSPAAHRLHSLLWHLLGVGLFVRVLRRLALPTLPAAAGAALFALHPAQVEAVLFVSARNDLMAAAALFGAVLLLDRGRHLAGALCLLAGLLCKETLLLAPLLVALFALARTGRPGGLRAHLAVLGAVLTYGALRWSAGVALPQGAEFDRILELIPGVSAWYARVLLWPVGLAPGVHVTWMPAWPWWALCLAPVLALLLGRLGGRRAWCGLVLALLTLGPVLPAIAKAGSVPDRYLYLPLAGLGLALAAALHGASLQRLAPRVQRLAPLAVALVGAALSSLLVPLWHDEATLWTTTLDRFPGPYSSAIYAKYAEEAGDLDVAAEHYARAVAPPTPYRMACFNASAIHLKRGDPAAAAAAGQAALDAGCAPYPELLAPMAVGLAATGQWEAAERAAAGVTQDPTGKAVIVRVAGAARRGDLGPLAGQPRGLWEQAAWLLEVSGEDASGVRAGMP